jgi:hypothetical protein
MELPVRSVGPGRDDTGPGANVGAASTRVARVEDHQPGVIDPTVGVLEAATEPPVQRLSELVSGQVQGLGRRQELAAADVVVEEQAEAQKPCRPLAAVVRQDEAQGPNDMGRHRPEDFAFDEGFSHQAELEVFQIAQSAVHQFGRHGRGPARQVVHLAQADRIAAPGGIARNAATVDPAADNEDVVAVWHRRLPRTISYWVRYRANSKIKEKKSP